VVAVLRFLGSPIGRKLINGLTGFFLLLFLIVHLGGNLLLFKSRLEFNGYSESLLKSWLIYPAEAGLALCFMYHGINATLMVLRNLRARPVRYQSKRDAGHTSRRSLASKTMIWTGVLLGIFLVVHIVTIKFGPGFGEDKRDVFGLVVHAFRSPAVVAFYVLIMLLLGFHLYHGAGTFYESLGVAHRPYLRRMLQGFAVLLSGAFLAIPVVVFFFGDKL
jgi:succinate dehydrogenase / fumarate reductase cytochrome b subunit